MTVTRRIRFVLATLAAVALAISSLCAAGERTHFDQPLVQARFDHLVPTSYPTVQTDFTRLRSTTWPLINPGIAEVHITENLAQAFARPVLVTDYAAVPLVTTPAYRVLLRSAGDAPRLPAVNTIPLRAGSSIPVSAKSGAKQVSDQQR